MRIAHISDSHNKLRWLTIPDADVLVHSGDATRRNSLREFRAFFGRMQRLPHRHKLFVPGNHDGMLMTNLELVQDLFGTVTVLIDKGIVIDGVQFYGMPWVAGVSTKYNGFTLPHGAAELSAACEKIPQNVNVLITHGPAEGILDTGQHRGCRVLRRHLAYMEPSEEPRYHLFGHDHAGYGTWFDEQTNIWHYNGACVTPRHEPVNPPRVIDL